MHDQARLGIVSKTYTGAVVIETLPNDLPTAHDDGSVAIVKGRLGGLVEAEREIVVSLHFCWLVLLLLLEA